MGEGYRRKASFARRHHGSVTQQKIITPPLTPSGTHVKLYCLTLNVRNGSNITRHDGEALGRAAHLDHGEDHHGQQLPQNEEVARRCYSYRHGWRAAVDVQTGRRRRPRLRLPDTPIPLNRPSLWQIRADCRRFQTAKGPFTYTINSESPQNGEK